MNKTLLFLIFGLGFIYLALDMFYGQKFIKRFVSGMFEAMTD